MWIALVALCLLATGAVSAEVTAKKLDGESIVGTLESWSDGQCVLATAEGRQPIATDQLLSLQWATAEEAEGAVRPTVELVDGSVLPLEGYTATGGKAHLNLRDGGSTAGPTVDVPLSLVRAAWLLPIEQELVGQWDEIRGLNLPSDVLVIFKQNGKSLDYVEGVVGEVTDAEVVFKLEDKELRVQRSKVAGVVYFRNEPPADLVSPCVLVGRDGLSAHATQVKLDGDQLHFVAAGELKLSWPTADLAKADFSAGKLAYLSDLRPVSEDWSPWVALPADASLASGYGRPRRDESAQGGPLALWIGDPASGGSGHLEVFDKGLSLRSRTELSYRLPRGFGRFLAVAGIEPSNNRGGDVQLTILGDDRPLWEGRVASGKPPQDLELEISGIKRLTIVVDYGDNLDTGDWLNLGNARIVK